MTIDKAINTLSAMQEDYEGDEFPNEEDALKLGIEALKRVKWHEEQHQPGHYELLPGETKDEVKSNYPIYDERSDEVYNP